MTDSDKQIGLWATGLNLNAMWGQRFGLNLKSKFHSGESVIYVLMNLFELLALFRIMSVLLITAAAPNCIS